MASPPHHVSPLLPLDSLLVVVGPPRWPPPSRCRRRVATCTSNCTPRLKSSAEGAKSFFLLSKIWTAPTSRILLSDGAGTWRRSSLRSSDRSLRFGFGASVLGPRMMAPLLSIGSPAMTGGYRQTLRSLSYSRRIKMIRACNLQPGLTGGSQDTYVRHMLSRARNQGWRVVIFNSRGCGNSPVTTPQFYSASYTGDMEEVVHHVSGRFPEAKLYAIGWSLGANILIRYLGQESHNCTLAGAVSLCNPFNLPIADEDFRKGFNNVYDKALANSLRKIFRKHLPLFEDIGGEFNIQMAANAKTVKEFDEGLTRVSFGFKSADDYYSKSSSSDSIKYVHIPLLCIQAANDPIAPARGIPRKDIEENQHCLLIVTPKGGHLGWVAGPDAPFGAPWTDPIVMDFLEHLERRSSGAVSSGQFHDTPQNTEAALPLEA